jgi:hypothetical protein
MGRENRVDLMRAVFSAAMAVLVVLALLAGNCYSCPQMLLALGTHQTSHGCCPHDKQPKTLECRTQSLRHFVKAETGAVIVFGTAHRLSLTPQIQLAIATPIAHLAEFSPIASIPIRV